MGDYVTDETSIEVFMPSIAEIGGFSAATRPTATMVNTFIDRREAELNSVLRKAGYSPPLTSGEDISHAALHVAEIVTFDAFVAHYELHQIPGHIIAFREDWFRFLEAIKNDELQFASETPLGAHAPVMYIARTPTRDEFWTERYDQTDWDE